MTDHRNEPVRDHAPSTAPRDGASSSPGRVGGGRTTSSLPTRPSDALPPPADEATNTRVAVQTRAAETVQRKLDHDNFGWGERAGPPAGGGNAESDRADAFDGVAAAPDGIDDEQEPEADPIADAIADEQGAPLPDAASYSDEVGADVSGARVVTGRGAEAAADAFDARAFTVGDRVFMGAGESPTDRALMAHELTHVAQQQDADAPEDLGALPVTSPSDASEHEADGAAAPAPGPMEIARAPRGVRTMATRNMEARVRALEPKADPELSVLKADLTARLSGSLSRKDRVDLARDRDAIEWVEYQRRLERGESGRAGTYSQELDAAQAAGTRHGVAANEIGARARLESAYRTGGSKEYTANQLHLGWRGNPEQSRAIAGQGASIEVEAATFKSEFREQAKHTALGMLDQSSVEIEAALAQHGFVGGGHRLLSAAQNYNRDPASLEHLVADWRALSDGDNRAAETRKGDKEQAKLATVVVELRQLQAEADGLERDEKGFTEADWAQRDAVEGARSSMAVKARLADAWLQAEAAHPILLAFRHQKYGPDTDRLGGLTSQGAGMEQAILRQAIPKLGNILRTRAAVRTDQLDPVRLAPVVELTKQQLQVPPGSARAAIAKDLYDAANQQSLADSVLSALSIALSVLSFAPGVGLGAKAAAEATSLAIELRAQVNEYKEWKVAGGMNNTALDMARSVSTQAPQMRPLLLRLAVAGASAASLLQLVKLSAQLKTIRAADGPADDVLRELDDLGAQHGVKNLGDQVEAAGAVRGAKVYPAKTFDKGDGVTRTSKINADRVQEGLKKTSARTYVGSARFEQIAGATADGATGVLRVPGKDGDTLIKVDVRFQGELSGAARHGAESGPARFVLDKQGSGPWVATIDISSGIEPRDVEFVLGHELDEIAELVRRHPTGKPPGGFGAEMEAGVMRDGAKTNQSTAHDVATAREIVALKKDLDKLVAVKAGSVEARKQSLDEAIKAAGLDEVAEIDAKVRLLQQAGAPDDLVDQVRMVASRHLADSHRAARGAKGTKFTEDMINHVMWGRDKGEFATKGVSGGHMTDRLLQMGHPNSEYVFVQVAEKAAGGSTARRFAQYKWTGDLTSMPQPGSGKFPTDKRFNDAGWAKTDMPKTTFDDPSAFLREAEEAWDEWVDGVALAPPGGRPLKQKEFTARTKSGVQISGYFEPAADGPVPTSVYPEASWF